MPAHVGLMRRGLGVVGRDSRSEPLSFGLAVVGSVLFALASVAFAAVLGAITDDLLIPALESGTSKNLHLLVVLISVAVVRSVGVVMRRYFAMQTIIGVRGDRRRRLADHILAAPVAYHRTHPPGQLLAHVDNDVDVSIEATSLAPFTIGAATLLLFAIAGLFAMDPLLAVIGVALLPMVAALNREFGRRMEIPSVEVRDNVGNVSRVGLESFQGSMVVKALGREEDEAAKFSEAAAVLRDAQVGLGRVFARFQAAIAALPDAAVILVVAAGAWRAESIGLTAGELVEAVALLVVLGQPISVMGWFLGELPHSTVARERIEAVLIEPVAEAPTGGTASLPDGPLSVDLIGLRFRYGEAAVINELDLAVRPGEVVALVGATASGKSTLLRLVAGLDRPERGEIRLGGVPVGDLKPDACRRRIGFALQEPFLFADTVTENIRVARDVDVERPARIACADEFIRRLPAGYDSVVGERGDTLSGGQRQRIALARALAGRPGLLLVDDALSAVDTTVEAEILSRLRELRTTIILVAHRRSMIEFADRVVLLDAGRVAGQGTPDDLPVGATAALVETPSIIGDAS